MPSIIHSCLIISLSLLLMLVSSISGADCPNGEDYSPCNCRLGGIISCDKIPLAEVQQIFSRTTPADFETFELTPLASETSTIPADLLVKHRVTDKIQVDCPIQLSGSTYTLRVDSNAFSSSRNSTQKVYIGYKTGNCDASGLDFAFLDGFEKMTELYISNSANIEQAGWASFPSNLNSFSSLTISFCPGLDNWTVFPVLTNGLSRLNLPINSLHDAAVDRILDWILTFSADTLRTLSLDNNALTTIPKQIPSFSKVTELHLGYQQNPPGIARIPSGSLTFGSEPVDYLFLDVAGIRTIESNAFQGNFGRTMVYLAENRLTRLESSVFQDMLEQMIQSTGNVDLSSNPIDCESDTCHLAWLCRDNRALLAALYNARCSNGTFIYRLDPNAFALCPMP